MKFQKIFANLTVIQSFHFTQLMIREGKLFNLFLYFRCNSSGLSFSVLNNRSAGIGGNGGGYPMSQCKRARVSFLLNCVFEKLY